MPERVSGTDTVDWSSRAHRLGVIVRAADVTADFPLVKAVRMSPAAFARLEGVVSTYIWHSLTRGYPGRAFLLSPSVLSDYAADIQALPNRTPNGVLLPRRETFLSFNMIHQALAGIFDELGLIENFSALQVPCNVRIVSGSPDPSAESRPYSSAKIHTDVWNGEPVSSVLFNIPVLGDPDAVDLRFYEPREFPSEMRVLLDDYALGDRVAASTVEYPVVFGMAHIYISDSLSLHKTVKSKPGLRVSLDLRAIAGELLPGEDPDCGGSTAMYVAPSVWRAAGSTTILGSGEPLDAFQRREKGETVTTAPPSITSLDVPWPPPY